MWWSCDHDCTLDINNNPHTTQAATVATKRHLGPEPAWVVGTKAAMSMGPKPGCQSALCASVPVQGSHMLVLILPPMLGVDALSSPFEVFPSHTWSFLFSLIFSLIPIFSCHLSTVHPTRVYPEACLPECACCKALCGYTPGEGWFGKGRKRKQQCQGWHVIVQPMPMVGLLFFFFPSKHRHEFLGMDLRRNDQEGVQGVQLHLGHGVKTPLPSKLKR